jgi:hypothetical protein
VLEPDALEDAPCLLAEAAETGERPERVPPHRREPEQRQHDVVLERVLPEQRDDLVGAGHPEVRALVRQQARRLLPEHPDRAGVGGEIAGDLVEERRLAGAVPPDDQAAFARQDAQRDVVRRRQPAEGLAEVVDLERGRHALAPRKRAHARRTPGTRPSGMNRMITRNTNPSSMFQRSMYADA